MVTIAAISQHFHHKKQTGFNLIISENQLIWIAQIQL
jgi:hypothetical protein